jgi:hypothetical protein
MPAPVTLIHERNLERLERLAWHARYNARTDQEAIHIDKLCAATAAGHISITDAHATLTHLRRQQTRAA